MLSPSIGGQETVALHSRFSMLIDTILWGFKQIERSWWWEQRSRSPRFTAFSLQPLNHSASFSTPTLISLYAL